LALKTFLMLVLELYLVSHIFQSNWNCTYSPFGCALPTSADECGDQQLAVSTRDFDQEYMILYICVHLCWRRLLQCTAQVESKVFRYTLSCLRKQWLPVNRRHIEKHAANIIKIKVPLRTNLAIAPRLVC